MTTIPQAALSLEGPLISRVVAGMMNLANWGLSATELLDWINAAVDLGITTFDHADIYGDYSCEELFGCALARDPSLRERLQLVSKCGIRMVSNRRSGYVRKHYDTGRDHVIASVENSLRCLQTSYLDLLLIHRPDPLLDMDELAEAFDLLRTSGKVLHFGVSNFSTTQFEALASRIGRPLVTNQLEFSVLHTDPLDNGVIDTCQKHKISAMAWAPLAGGRLFRVDTEKANKLRETLSRIGAALGGRTIDQIAIAWILKHPNRIFPVLGTGRLDRLEAAGAALAVQLSREQWYDIWSASTGSEVP